VENPEVVVQGLQPADEDAVDYFWEGQTLTVEQFANVMDEVCEAV
jgi:hypothetical protein